MVFKDVFKTVWMPYSDEDDDDDDDNDDDKQ